MFCYVCRDCFRYQTDHEFFEGFRSPKAVRFPHHLSAESLETSARQGCQICHPFWLYMPEQFRQELKAHQESKDGNASEDKPRKDSGWLKGSSWQNEMIRCVTKCDLYRMADLDDACQDQYRPDDWVVAVSLDHSLISGLQHFVYDNSTCFILRKPMREFTWDPILRSLTDG